MKKVKVAFFDFTSCEGCQLSKLNFEFKVITEIVSAPELKVLGFLFLILGMVS